MSEYEVTVMTRVKETYVVDAESAEDALKNWGAGTLVAQECIEVEEVLGAEEVS